jgi:GxxExxY protein
LEIKAVSYVGKNLTQQVVNYLKSTKMEVGLLINFGEKSLTWKRFINTPYSA